MNTCWKCATELEVHDRFCISCGTDQTQATAELSVGDLPARASVDAGAQAAVTLGPAQAVERVAAATPNAPPEQESVPTSSPSTAAEPPLPAKRTIAVEHPPPAPVEHPPAAKPARVAGTDPLPDEPIGARLRGSVHDAVAARQLLWGEVDGVQALVATIEAATQPAVGTVAGSVESHARLTSGSDLLAELRGIEAEVHNEVRAIGERNTKIAAHEAEIARLNRNRMLLIAAIVVAVVVLLIAIASAAS